MWKNCLVWLSRPLDVILDHNLCQFVPDFSNFDIEKIKYQNIMKKIIVSA